MKAPRVSVLMPVYNGERYVGAALDSILSQSYTDFELVIINDGSTDGSAQVVNSYRDPRIVYVANPVNTGLANVRNKGLDIVRGEYIAWLDCDDISLPQRLERQVELLDGNPRIGLCGTWVKTIGSEAEYIWRYPTDPDFLRSRMLFDDPFATSSIMMRAACIRKPEFQFSVNHPPAEDYELWERISRDWGVTNIPKVLTLYRTHAMQTSVAKVQEQKNSVWDVQNRILNQLGVRPSPDEAQLHLDIGAGWKYSSDLDRVMHSECWLLKLEAANRENKVFPELAFRRVLAERWMHAAGALAPKGFIAWTVYHRSRLSHWAEKRAWRALRLFMRCMRHG